MDENPYRSPELCQEPAWKAPSWLLRVAVWSTVLVAGILTLAFVTYVSSGFTDASRADMNRPKSRIAAAMVVAGILLAI